MDQKENTPLIDKAYSCLIGGLIGDAMGTPTEGMNPEAIEQRYGWLEDFEGDGTDDSVLKYLLCDALIKTEGYATADDWAAAWMDRRDEILGPKQNKFFVSVMHTFRKLTVGYLPREASIGNMASSSSAMSIAPVGIVNAGHPQAAAAQAQEVGSLIHTGDVSFCQDGAAAIAAAVAAGFSQNATLDSVLDASVRYLKPTSGALVRDLIEQAIALAQEIGEFKAFREVYQAKFTRPIMCDTRETVPATLALCSLAQGDPKQVVILGANFGRDADTIATMAGAICGALSGAGSYPGDWLEKVESNSFGDQRDIAEKLIGTAIKKAENEISAWQRLTKGN